MARPDAAGARPRVRVVAGLFVREGRVLVQERPAHKARGLLWELPGGKVEAGDTDAQALVRECAEELGVAASPGPEIYETVHPYDDLVVELHVLRAELAPGHTPEPRDAGQLRWVDAARLAALPFCAADRALIDAIVSGRVSLA